MKKKIKLIIIPAVLVILVSLIVIINKLIILNKNVEMELKDKEIKYTIESTLVLEDSSSELLMKSTVYAVTAENELYIYDIVFEGENVADKKMKKIKSLSVEKVEKLHELLKNAEEEVIIPEGYVVFYDDINKYIDKSIGDDIIKECDLN